MINKMPDFLLKRLSSWIRQKSNEEHAGIRDIEYQRTREQLEVLNGQMDEHLDHFLTKKLTKRIHEADTFDQIPDELEPDIARYSIKLALFVLRDVITDLIQRDLTRQAALDKKQEKSMDQLRSAIRYMAISVLSGGIMLLGWVFRTLIWRIISGEIPIPIP